jgi:hypothetical protein
VDTNRNRATRPVFRDQIRRPKFRDRAAAPALAVIAALMTNGAKADPIEDDSAVSDLQSLRYLEFTDACNTRTAPAGAEAFITLLPPAEAVEILPETTAVAVAPVSAAAVPSTQLSAAIEITFVAGASPGFAGNATAAADIRRPASIVPLDEAHAPFDAEAEQVSIPVPQRRPPVDVALAAWPTPAERLGLDLKGRDRAEVCLAEAIYFESRGETVRGQIGVAQVIMNRVFSRFYPDSVCAVVYQNAHRRNACQFSFACNGRRKVIKDQPAWDLARHLARLTLDGRVWDAEIGKATHYHATFVNPWWVSTMTKLTAHGIHVFYRPTRWGDGSDEPNWSRVAHSVMVAVN